MSRASTPTAPAPTPAPAASPAAAPAPTRTWTPAITITPPTSSSTDTGQPPEPPARDSHRDRAAKIAERQASRMAARQPDDTDDADSQDDEAPEAARTPLGQPAPAAKPETPAAAPEPSAREKNAARIRESLKAQAAAREAEQARRAAQTQPAQPPATQAQQQSAARFWAEVRRHPQGVVAGLREQGWDDKTIRAALDDMTNDAIAPGTVRAQAAAEDGSAELRRTQEQLNGVVQHIQTREQAEYREREKVHFHSLAQAKDGEEVLYPNASRLSADKLYKLAERIASEKPQGSEYTLESLLLDVESEIEALLPAPNPPPSPANPPASTTTPAAKTKHTRAALPPDLAGESGKHQPKPRTERERSAAILRRAKQRIESRARSAG